jgi:hypothetical protein
MGTNGLSMHIVPVDSDLAAAKAMQFCIVSGGDDQSLCWCHGSLVVSVRDSVSTSVVCKYVERITGASGSAIKAVRFVSMAAGTIGQTALNSTGECVAPEIYVAYVGYDQRLSVLKVLAFSDDSNSIVEPNDIDDADDEVVDDSSFGAENLAAHESRSDIPFSRTPVHMSTLFLKSCATHELPVTRLARWVAGRVVPVGDIADMDIISVDGKRHTEALVSVVGEGFETLVLT